MIKSFLKKVFSSSSSASEEVAATTEQRLDTDKQAQEHEGVAFSNVQEYAVENEQDENNEVLTIHKEWLNTHSFSEINKFVTRLYEKAEQSDKVGPVRLRIRLDESLQEEDIVTSKRISKYLSHAEQEIVDLTYFLDKDDPETMEIYREYVLPQEIELLNSFLQERCFMIYETSAGLMEDYRVEIEHYFHALDVPMNPNFFEDFDLWREEVLRHHENEPFEEEELLSTSHDVVMIKVSKEEVENENIQQIDHYLKAALQSPESAKEYKGTLLFSFYGFSKHEDLLKLMNRKEVNDWASLLVEKHPYIFYFLNDEDYPMTQFLTSLVVATEVEEGSVYYNDEELIAFKEYIVEALESLADWIQEDKEQVVTEFTSYFG